MPQSASVQVRVNGVLISQVRLRGFKSDPRLVIVDPVIGAFEIDDDRKFSVEMLDLNIPTEIRSTLPNGGWKHISVKALVAVLRGATEDAGAEDGDRSSWVHASDLAEIEGLTTVAEPCVLRARRGFRKAARILYSAGIPYLIVGEYESPEDSDACTRTALVLVPDSSRALEHLCSKGFRPHPTNVNSLICAEYNCVVHLVSSKKPKRKRNDPDGRSRS